MTSRVRINASNVPVLFYAVPDERDTPMPNLSFDCRVVSLQFTEDDIMVLIDRSTDTPSLPGYFSEMSLPTSAHIAEYLGRNGFADTSPEIIEMTPGENGAASRCVYLATPSRDPSAFSPLAWMEFEEAGQTLSADDIDAVMEAMMTIANADD